MSQLVVIAGATGALGRHAIDAFRDAGYRVRALARPSVRFEALRGVADEIFPANALQAEALIEPCKGANVVLSAIGASVLPSVRLGRASFENVDTPANLNLINAAQTTGVGKFVYVSLHCEASEMLQRVRYVRSHERVVEALARTSLPYCIVRPTGFFSAFGEFVAMAKRGQPAPVFGGGAVKTNPVHEADVAQLCAEAARSDNQLKEISIGGPDILTRREIAELAFAALGKRPRIISAPLLAGTLGCIALRPFHPRMADLIEFIVAISKQDVIAPARGRRRLCDYFRELAAASRAS